MAGKTKAKTQAPARRQALVVAGMHRSGTSAMARLLSLAGATLPERVMDPGPDNPMGYWEPWEMVALDDAILQAVGSRWDDIFALSADARAWAVRDQFMGRAKDILAHNFENQDLLVIKDPRASVLTRFWQEALNGVEADPVYIIMVRHPLEVANSLQVRNGFSREKCLLLWTSYMLAVERDTRAFPRLFVTYEDLLSDWRGVLDRLEKVLGKALPNRTPASDREIAAFLSRSHRHHQVGADDLDISTLNIPGVSQTYDWMIAAAEGRVGPSKSLESAAKDILALEGFMGPILFEARDQLPDQLAKTEARLAEVEAEAKALKEHFDAFHAEADARAQAAAAERYVLQEQLLAARQETEALAKLRLKELEQHHRETVASIEKIDILRQNLDISARSEAELGERLNHAQALVESYSNEIQLIFNSTSWKITGPLRSLVKRLRRA